MKRLIFALALLTGLSSQVQANSTLYDEVVTVGFNDTWILVDSENSRLSLFDGKEKIRTFYASIGGNGASDVRRMGDRTTPTGVFSIDDFNFQSKFKKFFRINYPTDEHVEKGLRDGIINMNEYFYIKDFKARHGYPPQQTKLGGYIGIHGLGNKDPYLHTKINWTDGCIAVNNNQIEYLAGKVRKGTKVVIL